MDDLNEFFKYRHRLNRLSSRWKSTDDAGIPTRSTIQQSLNRYAGGDPTAIHRNFPLLGFRSLDPHAYQPDKPFLDGTNARLTTRVLTVVRHRKAIDLPPYAMTGDFVFLYGGGIQKSVTDTKVCTLMGISALNYELFNNYETSKMSSSVIAAYIGREFGVLWYMIDLPATISPSGGVISVIDDYKTAVVNYQKRTRMRNYWCVTVVPLHLRVIDSRSVGRTLWFVLQKVVDQVYLAEEEARRQNVLDRKRREGVISAKPDTKTEDVPPPPPPVLPTTPKRSKTHHHHHHHHPQQPSSNMDTKHTVPPSSNTTATTTDDGWFSQPPIKVTGGVFSSSRKRKQIEHDEEELHRQVSGMIADTEAERREIEEMLTRNQPKTGNPKTTATTQGGSAGLPAISAATPTATAPPDKSSASAFQPPSDPISLRDTYQLVEAGGRKKRDKNLVWQLVPYVTLDGEKPVIYGHLADGYRPRLIRVGKVLNADTVPTTAAMDEHTFPITPEWNKSPDTLSAIDVLLDPDVF